MRKILVISITAIVLSVFSCKSRKDSTGSDGLSIMAYYYAPRGDFEPSELPLDKLTHIIYSFTGVINNEMKFENDSSGIKLKMLVKEGRKHSNLRVMVACGGWGGSGGFSEMARSADNRAKFVRSTVEFLEDYKLDGLDIDWEYPGMEGIGNPFIPEDKQNFTLLMKELRGAMDATGRKMVLTFAAAGWIPFFDHIELAEVMKYVTYINIMSYDLVTGGTPHTGHHTNLGWVKSEDISGTPAAAKMLDEGDSIGPSSAERVIAFCMDQGVGPGQIIIGAAFYGRGWKGVPPENNGLYQLNQGPWPQNTRYSSIRENYEDKNGFVRHWDSVAKAPFLYHAADSVFITYEDTVSIRLKTEYSHRNKLGGIMFWQLGSDAKDDGLVDAIYAEKMKWLAGPGVK